VQSRQQQGHCQEQDLNLTGEVTAHVRIGLLLPAVLCDPSLTYLPRGTAFQFVEGAQLYTLGITPDQIASPVEDVPYQSNLASVVHLDYQAPVGSQRWQLQSGRAQVNPDKVSGTVDAILVRDAQGAGQVHLTGTWRCSK
jgi:hypothetical protein